MWPWFSEEKDSVLMPEREIEEYPDSQSESRPESRQQLECPVPDAYVRWLTQVGRVTWVTVFFIFSFFFQPKGDPSKVEDLLSPVSVEPQVIGSTRVVLALVTKKSYWMSFIEFRLIILRKPQVKNTQNLTKSVQSVSGYTEVRNRLLFLFSLGFLTNFDT